MLLTLNKNLYRFGLIHKGGIDGNIIFVLFFAVLMFTHLFLGYSESYADVKYILVRQNTNRNSVTNMEEDETA